MRAKQGDPRRSRSPQAVGAQRLVDFARQAEVHDKRLWTPIAAAVGGAGNTTALVGTPEQVAESLLDYYDLGVTTLLIRGFDPLQGRDRVRPRADPAASAPRWRAATARAAEPEAMPPSLLAVVGAVTPPGRLNAGGPARRWSSPRRGRASPPRC